MKYVIKDNLPKGIIKPTGEFSRRNAAEYFIYLINYFNVNGYEIKTHFRNEANKPLRGTILVLVDGFYYYVELYAL